MKKTVLFSTFLAFLAIVSLYVFASAEPPVPELLSINIVGPDSVPEDTQNIYRVVAVYNDGSNIEVTADTNIKVVSDECKVINIGGIVETFKMKKAEKQFTIYACYRDFETEKTVTVYRHQENK